MNKNKVIVIGISGESNFYKVDNFGKIGETIISSTFHKEYGGKGYNQAVTLARMGCDVVFLTAFGNDDIKNAALKVLEEEKVKTYYEDLPGQSASAAIIIDSAGDNKVFCFPGVSSSLTKDSLKLIEKEFESASYILLQLECNDELLKEAINLAIKYNVKVVLNPAPAHKLEKDILDKCYLLTPNEGEAKLLFNIDNFDSSTLLSLPYNNIIITLGKDGSIVKMGEKIEKIPALNVKQVNSTGAGDVYNGVLVSFLNKGYNLLEASKYASIGAGLSVKKEFVIDSIPYLKDVVK